MEENKKSTSKSILKRDSKINKLFTKLGITAFIFLLFCIILIIVGRMLLVERNSMQDKLNSLRSSNDLVQRQIRDIDTKAATAKNYVEVWEKEFIPQQKLLKGINIDDVRTSIIDMANNNFLTNIIIEFSPVILAGKPLENTTIRTYTTLVTIKFNAITDINAYQFFDEFKDKIGYFITIQELTLKRTKRVDEEFLKNLSDGNIVTTLDGEVKIRLYGLGENKVVI